MSIHLRFTAALPQELNGDRLEVIFVKEGPFVDGKYYVTAEALQAAHEAGTFENVYVQELEFKDGTLRHLPHPLEHEAPGGVFSNAIGITAGTALKVLEDGKAAIVGFIDVIDEKFKSKVRNIIKAGRKLPGVSFNALISADKLKERAIEGGRKILDVFAFQECDTFEVVTYPNAGGTIIRAVADNPTAYTTEDSPQHTQQHDRTIDMTLKEQLVRLFAARDISVDITDEMTPLEIVQAALDMEDPAPEHALLEGVKEAMEAKLDKVVERLVAAIEALPKEKDKEPEQDEPESKPEQVQAGQDFMAQLQKQQEEFFGKVFGRLDSEKAERAEHKRVSAAQQIVNDSALPESMKPLALKHVLASKEDPKTVLDEYIKGVAPLQEEGRVRASYSPMTGMEWGMESKEKKQIALTRMLGGVPHNDKEKDMFQQVQPFNGIPEAFGELTGIWNLTFTDFQNPSRVNQRRVGAAFDYVDISDFPLVLGNTMNRVIVDLYGEMPHSWKEFTSKRRGVKNFKDLQLNRIGGFGTLDKYTDTNSGRDDNRFANGISIVTPDGEQRTSYQVDIYSNQWVLTYKALRDDDLNVLVQWMNNFAQMCDDTALVVAMSELLNMDASGNINAGTTGYDSTALYTAAHKNLMAKEISYDNVYEACQMMRMQRSFGTNNPKPLRLRPYALVGPESLRREIENIVGIQTGEPMTTGHTKNALTYLKPLIFHDDDMGENAHNWLVIADPTRNATIEMAFLDDNENPTILTQKDPTVGLAFTHLETVFSGIWMGGACAKSWETAVMSIPTI